MEDFLINFLYKYSTTGLGWYEYPDIEAMENIVLIWMVATFTFSIFNILHLIFSFRKSWLVDPPQEITPGRFLTVLILYPPINFIITQLVVHITIDESDSKETFRI
jgi:hypothetical protein